jgi:outer membrane protein TolC
VPLFDQRQSQLLAADAELRSAMRRLEVGQLAARTNIRTHLAQLTAARRLVEQFERDVRPNQQLIAAGLGTVADPGEPTRLRLRLSTLVAEEDYVALLRDYWRTRSALGLAAGSWSEHSGL